VVSRAKDLSHVRDVEDAASAFWVANVEVFVSSGGEEEGHFPARKISETGREGFDFLV